MKRLDRRTLLKRGSTAALGVLGSCSGRASCDATSDVAPKGAHGDSSGDDLRRDPAGIIDLPEGFTYRVLQRTGETMGDGYRVPERPDGMGCFAGPDSTLILMRNHEGLETDSAITAYFPGQSAPPEAYDAKGTGGVTRVVLDAATLKLRHSNLVLAGTYWNCAGGHSPWGWLSCEETMSDNHGYVFLCRTDSDRVRAAERIAAYGRFRHEAATVDPKTQIAYLTEDRPDSCFYRFLPRDQAQPFVGALQALRIVDRNRFDTAELRPGKRLPIDWVTIDQPVSREDNVSAQGMAKGAACVRRGEGLWQTGNEVYFSATAGGMLGRGQVLKLTLGAKPTLETIAETTDPEVLDMPDNLCVSPHGVLYIAEDGSPANYLRRVSPQGRVVAFARNALNASEFAGLCFSPDGNTLFANIQGDGTTLAIRGPFDRPLKAELRPVPAGLERGWARGARGLGGGLAVLALAALAHRRCTGLARE